ncbi:MAG: prepilin-type N-terminal cleavage/methylation domain-containing protein [Phycisphaerales bacterium]|nr:prepilin-type N-terminal cleavage/methylation domain-containing protein [Phycisphaerales bacterium]
MTRKPRTTGIRLAHGARAPRVTSAPYSASASHAADASLRRPRRGISLAEMMIAVVILGLGLLMVATLFPVSWLSARKLAEHTTTLSCQEAAHQALETLLKVDGADEPSAVLLAGDQMKIGDCTPCEGAATVAASSTQANGAPGAPIPRVHAFNMANVLFEGKRQFVSENIWDLERTTLGELVRVADGDDVYDYEYSGQACVIDGNANNDLQFNLSGRAKGGVPIRSFLSPIVALQDRVYPPLPNRPTSDFTKWTAEDQRWDDSLGTRRYAWSAFYRFDTDYVKNSAGVLDLNQDGCDGTSGEPLRTYNAESIDETRVMTVYTVTLRRPRANMRYARQDPEFVPHPDPREALRDGPTAIQALGADKDLMFPSPWRVQVLLPEKLGSRARCADPDDNDPRKCPTGVATEITVNDASLGRIDDTSPSWAVDLFDRGTIFIDELSGQIYRVEKRRLTDDDTVAHLTLDREIVIEDKGINFGDEDSISACDPSKDPDCSPCDSFKKPPWNVPSNRHLDDCERLRTVWVFPPPVQGGRGAGEPLAFDGSPPVVDISVRTLTVAP